MLIHLYVCIGNDGDDDCALERLHTLADMYVGEVALGYMAANGIISKVLAKFAQVEQFDGGTPSRFVMSSFSRAKEKLAIKRKDHPQASGSSCDHRPYKGAKNK